jgi:hypothetical protein
MTLSTHLTPAIRRTLLPVVIVAGLALAACGSGGSDASDQSGADNTARPTGAASGSGTPTVLERPALFADLPEVTLLTPGAEDAGLVPEFSWEAVDGAASYRLSVLGPDRPLWAWSGTGTTVSLGLREGPSEAVPGLELPPGSWWSVAALDDDGQVVAVSALRSVSPEDAQAAPAPPAYFAAGLAVDAPADEEEAAAAVDEDPEACSIVERAEIEAALGADASEGAPTEYSSGDGTDCEWRLGPGSNAILRLEPGTDAYEPEQWVKGEPVPVPGLGDASYLYNDHLTLRLGFTHGDWTVLISAWAGNEEGYVAMAKAIDARLP